MTTYWVTPGSITSIGQVEMDNSEIIKVLNEIRALQKQQVASMSSMLDAQLQHMDIYQKHITRVEKINNHAERIQHKSESMINVARKGIGFLLAIVIVLVCYLSWILFFR